LKKHDIKLVAALGGVLGVSACTAGQTGPPTVTAVSPVQNGNTALSLAVGTANIAGHTGLSLNVVPLYRQKNGSSAVLVDTPKLIGPFTLPTVPGSLGTGSPPQYDVNSTAATGPSGVEIAGKFIEGSPQSGQIGTPSSVNSTFGTNGGVFGNGFAPVNYGTSGTPADSVYTPYFQPFYAGLNVVGGAVVTTNNTFVQSASAPAFDPAGNGHGPTGPNFPVNGLSLGLNVFQGVVPGAGTYTLSVAIATTGSAAPAVTFNGDGTITTTNLAIAAPVVGAYVETIDYGDGGTNCNGASVAAPVYYTQWVTASGAVTLSNANAPYGQTVAICTAADNTAAAGAPTPGDQIQVVVIGFDYNEYGLQYNGKTGATYPQKPALPAQADSSISLSTYAVSP
jgi:hypothetical protein